MSHFAVLVIGPNVEGQLAPYEENTEVDRYKKYQDEDPTSWPRSAVVEDGVDPTDDLAVAAMLNKKWGDDESYEVDEKGLYHWSTYNPQSKWDWYEVGGRWTGHFLLKPGSSGTLGTPGLMTPRGKPGTADQATKGAIDFDLMKLEAASGAAEQFDRYAAIVAEHPPIVDFDAIEGDVEHRRSAYWAQTGVKALQKANLIPWHGTLVETYGMGRDEYIQRAALAGPTTYAMVAEGVWRGKGNMGWFGMSDDTADDRDKWLRFWWQMVDAAPDDTLFTVVDCHI